MHKKITVEENIQNDLTRKIDELTRENDRLSREINNLKNELREYKGKSKKNTHSDKYQISFHHRADTEYMFSRKSFVSFVFAQIKCTSFFNIYKKVVNAFRKYSFITTSLKVFSILFLIIEASILVVLSTSAFIASIVFTLFISHLSALFTLVSRRKHNKINEQYLKDKNVTIFFPPKERAFDSGSYFCGFVREEAKNENAVVIIVSPYVFKSIGLEKSKSAYLFCRPDGENIMLVRHRYYFTLRKKIIGKVSASIKEIY